MGTAAMITPRPVAPRAALGRARIARTSGCSSTLRTRPDSAANAASRIVAAADPWSPAASCAMPVADDEDRHRQQRQRKGGREELGSADHERGAHVGPLRSRDGRQQQPRALAALHVAPPAPPPPAAPDGVGGEGGPPPQARRPPPPRAGPPDG